MNTIEDRIRAAARAAAGTVPPDSVPPLRLPAGRPSRFRRGHRDSHLGVAWARRMAPLAAAVAVVAVAVAVVTISRSRHEPVTSTGTAAPGGVTPGPPLSTYVRSGQVPPYYVAITSHGNPNFNPSYAVVQATVSGKTLATIKPSVPGGTIVAVTAAADDRTFVLDEQHWVIPQNGNQSFEARTFYMFRLSSSGQPGPLTRLAMSIPAGQMVTGLALSPDGRKLAIAVEPDNVKKDPNLQQIRLYTLATGAVRIWSGNGTIGSGPEDARSMSWTADQRTLAFDWIGNNTEVVRLLNVDAPGNSLLADSRVATFLTSPQQQKGLPTPRASSLPTAATPGTGSPVSPGQSTVQVSVPALQAPTVQVPTMPCQEDSIITPDGSTVVCGAIEVFGTSISSSPNGGSPLKRGAVTGFFEYSTATGKVTHILGRWTFGNVGALSIDVLWSNPSGSVLIAVIPTAGDGRVGVIYGNTFTPIAARMAGVAPDTGTW
jgi:hypothetical protein